MNEQCENQSQQVTDGVLVHIDTLMRRLMLIPEGARRVLQGEICHGQKVYNERGIIQFNDTPRVREILQECGILPKA